MGKQQFGGGGKGNFKKGKPSFQKGKQSFKNKSGFKGKNKFNNKRTPTFDVNARLCIRNLSFKTTEESLKQHFEAYGRIAGVTLLKRPNGDLVGCGFVQYESIENANLAVSNTNKRPFLGRAIQVELALPKDQFVANRKEALAEVKDEIKTEVGEEEDQWRTRRGGYDNAEGKDDDSWKKDSRKNNKKDQYDEKNIKSDQNEENKKAFEQRQVKKARIIVRNISFKVTEESLRKHFEPHGEVQEVTLLKKPNGDLVGCGFIQFKNVQMATKAILQTNAKPFLGRPIHVDWAVAKNKYMSHVTQQQDEEEYLKNEVKSEPESDGEDSKPVKLEDADDSVVKDEETDDEDDDDSSKGSDESDDDDQSDADVDEEGADDDDAASQQTEDPNKLKVSANDAEDGRTIFLKNIPFSVVSEDLEDFAKEFGEVQYALVCVDKLTEHSKGTGFIRFKTKEDADIFLSAGPSRMMLQGQAVEPYPAMFRDRVLGTNSKTKKQPKDSRNLYLIKEGVILANSKASAEVSASDMAKRLTLEQNKSSILRNLNRFISRYRLTIHNLPPHYADEDLRKLCLEMANVKHYALKECRVMKHLKGPLGADGKHMSKGFGFVMFTKHEDALACLRRLNNNPSVFDKNNRPIVAFSIEDKAVINARKKRLEKSMIRNPLNKAYVDPAKSNEGDGNIQANKGNYSKPHTQGNKRKFNSADQESAGPTKKSKFDKKKRKSENANEGNSHVKLDANNSSNEQKFQNKKNTKGKSFGKDVRVNDNKFNEDYSGETAKPGGSMKMRSRYHLRVQNEMHKEAVKQDKKKKRLGKRNQNTGVEERVKQPKQKQNTNINAQLKKSYNQKDEKSFSDLVNKYKSKLVGSSKDVKVKSKWYEQSA